MRLAKKIRNNIDDKGKIAQEALDFEVLNYSKIAAEQKKLREEKEAIQRDKIKKLIRFSKNDEDEEIKHEESNNE